MMAILLRLFRPFLLWLNAVEACYSHGAMNALNRLFGPDAAIWWMSDFPLRRRAPARLLWLHHKLLKEYGSTVADEMALRCLTHHPTPRDYNALLCQTEGHLLSDDTLKSALDDMMRAATKPNTRIALVVALIERGDPENAVAVAAQSTPKAPMPPALDALVPRPLGQETFSDQTVCSPRNWNLPNSKHRLLVCDEAFSPGIIAFLARGAEKLTILQHGELYGHLDIDAISAKLPGVEIAVEFARNRTDRFQQRYYELHKETEQIASQLGKAFVSANPWAGSVAGGNNALQRDMTLELGDRLFFRALQFEAVLQAVADPKFDHVLFVFSDYFELFRLCFSQPQWLNCPRIQTCCWSYKPKALAKFGRRQNEIVKHVNAQTPFPSLRFLPEKPQMPLRKMPVTVIGYLNLIRLLARRRGSQASDFPTSEIALVTQASRAYSFNAVQLAAHLGSHFSVDVIWLSGNEEMFHEHLARLAAQQEEKGAPPLSDPNFIRLTPFPPTSAVVNSIRNVTLSFLAAPIRALLTDPKSSPAVACAVDCFTSGELLRHMLRVVGRAAVSRTLLQQRKYRLVAISPVRTPFSSQFASIARSLSIPSLTIEPHCLNASYCRYGTIPTDYAAVYSQYYAEEYNRNFGISEDRCKVFGSPRILRPDRYDAIASRPVFRTKLGFAPETPPIILVPTQPMPAAHILAVWRMILRAAKRLDQPVLVLLKSHPEEGQAHIARYRQIITEEGMDASARVVQADIKDLLIASHLVLTAYSVTALEAVVLERNVAMVSQPGVDYPTDYAAMIGLPLCCTEEETAHAIRDALELGADAPSAGRAFRKANPYLFDNSCFERLETIAGELIAQGSAGIRAESDLSPSLFVTAPFREYLT